MDHGVDHAPDLRRIIVDHSTVDSAQSQRRDSSLLVFFSINRAFDLCDFQSCHSRFPLRESCLFLAELFFLFAGTQTQQTLHGRFDHVVGIAATDCLGQDILNTCGLQDRSHGTTCYDSGTG